VAECILYIVTVKKKHMSSSNSSKEDLRTHADAERASGLLANYVARCFKVFSWVSKHNGTGQRSETKIVYK
jgi:hypothetical protein